MELQKFNSYKMEKCYAANVLNIKGKKFYVVAAEKTDDCCLFDEEGNYVETIWKGPSGTMSIVPLEDLDGGFLATRQFYSPNDSKEARVMAYVPNEKGWDEYELAKLPFVHRFDVIERKGKRYVVGSTIKNQHDFKDDWTHPGKIWVASLPRDMKGWVRDGGRLDFVPIADGFTRNHGYCLWNGKVVVSSDEGAFLVDVDDEGVFSIKKLCSDSISDISFTDFDGDGKDEMLAILPFHGDRIAIYHQIDDCFEKIYEYNRPLAFAHAIWTGKINGKNVGLIGNRRENMEMVSVSYEESQYSVKTLERNVGPANFWCDGDVLISTNREIDEIAFYRIK